MDKRVKAGGVRPRPPRSVGNGTIDGDAERYGSSVLRRAAVGLLCAKIALIPLVFDPLALNVFAQPKALIASVFDLVLIALFVAIALDHGRSMLVRSPLHIPVVGFAAAYLAASAFALDRRVAVFGTPDRQLGLMAAIDNVLVYVAVVLLARTRTDILWLGASLAASAAVALGYGLLQWVGADPVSWGRPPSEALFSTLGNRGVLAQFLATACVASLGVAAAPGIVGRRVRAAAAALALLALVGVLAAGARAALLGLIAGTAALAGIRVIWEEDRRRRVLSAITAVVLAAAAIAVTMLSPVGQRFEVLLRDPAALITAGADVADLSVAARLDLYRAAWEVWRERPLLGVGPDNYAVAFPQHRRPESNRLHDALVPQTSTHSWIAKVATDAGVLGLLAYLGAALVALFLAVGGARQPWRLAAAGGIAAFLGTGALSVSHVATEWLPWLGFGVMAAPIDVPVDEPVVSSARGRRKARERRHTARVGRIGMALAAAALLIGALGVKDPLQASRYAQIAAGGKTTQQVAVAAAQRATALDPGKADYWSQLGGAYLRSDRAAEAERSLARAVALAPYHTTYATSLARIRASLGLKGDRRMLSAGLETASGAASADPNNPDALITLAIVAQVADDPVQSVAAGERALAIGSRPSDPTLYIATSASYLELRRHADAERWARLGLELSGVPLPQLSALRLQLARTLRDVGRRSDAIAELDRLLADDPGHSAAQQLKRQIEAR